jgi:hypothetical protein
MRNPRRDGAAPGGLANPALKLSLPCKHPLLGIRQHAVEPAEHRQRQNDVLIMAAPEGIADQIRHPPDKADDLAMVHVSPLLTIMTSSPAADFLSAGSLVGGTDKRVDQTHQTASKPRPTPPVLANLVELRKGFVNGESNPEDLSGS